jgi:hypothetical protein
MALRIAVITDIHYGIDIGAKKGTQALPLVDEFIDAAAAFKADLILNLGDEISTRDPESDEKFKATLRHHFNRAACPVIKIDGNHCVRFQERQSVSRSFDMDKFHIVMWNPYMNRYTRDGVIPDPQDIEWLENDLSGTGKPTIILSHIPFRGPESEKKQLKRAQTEGLYYPSHFAEAENLQEIIESSGKVMMCLSGHRHLDYHETANGVHHIIQQSLVEVVADGKPSGAYNLIEIDDDEIRINGVGLKRNIPASLPVLVKPSSTPIPQVA